MKRRVIREQGTVDGVITNGKHRIVECTLADGGRIAFREGATDALILYELLWREQYRRMADVVNLLDISVDSILDGGANIGAFTLFAKRLYPAAKIVCVEPDPDNHSVLEHNLKLNGIDDCVVLDGAVWSECGPLFLGGGCRHERERELSFFVQAEAAADAQKCTPGYSVQSLAEKYCAGRFNVVKLDVEGAEAQILRDEDSINALLSICDLLVLEIHDDVFDRLQFSLAIKSLGCTSMSDGELTYVWK